MLSVTTVVLAVLSASNKDEAHSKFSKIMEQINKLGAGADTMLKLYFRKHGDGAGPFDTSANRLSTEFGNPDHIE